MSSKRVVMLTPSGAYLLEGYRNSWSHIRGRVVNGEWTLFVLKNDGETWLFYPGASSMKNCLGPGHPVLAKDVSIIEVPETMFGDYNVIINWAKARKEKPNVPNNRS